MTYHRPKDIQTACSLATLPGARIIAGGTDILVRVEKGMDAPAVWVDISQLPLADILWDEGENVLSMGATCTMSQLACNPLVLKHAPLVAQAAVVVGAPGIRNRATLGGNLANASPAADVSCALMALDAELVIVRGEGKRLLPIQEFFLGPGRTVLEKGEILSGVNIPFKAPPHAVRTLSHWFKAGNRRAQVISMVAFAGRTWLDAEDRIIKSSLAVASVAPRPLRLSHVESLLLDKVLSPELIEQASRMASGEVTPIDDVRSSAAYRRHLSSIFVQWHLEDVPAGASASVARSTSHGAGPGRFEALARHTVASEVPAGGPYDLIVNGSSVTLHVPGDMRLLDALRDELLLTGTKNGCGEGECGACMVLCEGQPVNACLVTVGSVAGRRITTVEGMSRDGTPGLVQQAFIDAGAVQCGFCIPGCEITAQALLDEEEPLSREEIAAALSGNLCRCTGYVKIIDAVALALSRRVEERQGGGQ